MKAQLKLISSADYKFVRRALAAVAAIFFVVVNQPPMAVHADYQHDDGLFMALGKHLAAGEWLGPYSQFTLMKGPGYAVFLAASSWLGLPLVLSHALFHCATVGLFFWIFARISRMPNLALCGFLFTLAAPIDYFDRVTRDAIYPGQMLLVLATLCYALFGKLPRRNRFAWAVLCGLSAGWLALTREEGIWIAPGIVIIGLYAVWTSWRGRADAPGALPLLFAAAMALASTQGAFYVANRLAYGTATGVETNSAPFTSALRALQAVQVGEPTPYLPVPRRARFAIYAQSPTFRRLRGYLDPIGGATPWQFGCQFYRATCGDIAGGWFLWAFRDAAANDGVYTSPADAADFYRKVAREVEQACTTGRLTCAKALPAPLPHIASSQLRNIPASLISGIRLATYWQPPDITPEASSGESDQVVSDIAFLGRPATTPPAHVDDSRLYRFTGWYRSPSNGWVSAKVELADGSEEPLAIARVASPDLVAGFKDPAATMQRFDVEVACSAPCHVRFTGDGGASALLNLTELVGQRPSYPVGPATLNIDSVGDRTDAASNPDTRLQTATAVRRAAIRLYAVAVPRLAALAVVAMLLASIRVLVTRRVELVWVLATAVWALLAARLTILAIVDISLFPGMITQYLSAANVLVCLAVVLSFGAFLKSVGTLRLVASLHRRTAQH